MLFILGSYITHLFAFLFNFVSVLILSTDEISFI